jgi:quercetin dioxygenase-like cupin family protein
MTADAFSVTYWEAASPPTKNLLLRMMEGQGLNPYEWSNEPHDSYSAHKHDYNKVIYVVRGSITFGLPVVAQQVTLYAGDRLEIPAGTVHDAHVGMDGVLCLEARRE